MLPRGIKKGAESLRIKQNQDDKVKKRLRSLIFNAKLLWGSLDLEQKSSADEREPYKDTVSEETAVE